MSKRNNSDNTAPAGQATEFPAYWFLLMEAAKGRGDFDEAAHAKRELERLGVQVVYGPPRPAQKEAAHVA
jgi:hypothetical protein